MARTFHMDTKMQSAATGFDAAMQDGRDKFSKALPAIQAKQPNYAVIEVARYRKAGVQPIDH